MSVSLPWFRMYTDFLNDPKMIALSFEDQRHFIGILALKSDGALDTDCDPDLLNRIVAQRLWIDHAIIKEVKKRLVRAGLISDDWQPLAWNKRQFKSDSSKDRVAKFRAKKQQEAAERYGNGEVTLQKRPSNAIDTDTDTDKEVNTLSGKPDGAPKNPSPETLAAKEIIGYLNNRTGARYRNVEANLRLVKARLAEGATPDEIKAVIDMKAKEWSGTDSAKYLRPETLFNATKYNQYAGQIGGMRQAQQRERRLVL